MYFVSRDPSTGKEKVRPSDYLENERELMSINDWLARLLSQPSADDWLYELADAMRDLGLALYTFMPDQDDDWYQAEGYDEGEPWAELDAEDVVRIRAAWQALLEPGPLELWKRLAAANQLEPFDDDVEIFEEFLEDAIGVLNVPAGCALVVSCDGA